MRWKLALALPIVWLTACQDSGKTPFSDGKLFQSGGSGPSLGGSTGNTGGKSGTGGTGGNGGTSGTGGTSSCYAGYYDSCDANSDCCDYPSDAVCVNFTGVGTYCAPRCTYDADCEENCCLSTKQGNYVCHPSSSCN